MPHVETPAAPTRRPHITRDDLIRAALRLLGPHRSVSSLSLREVSRAAQIAPNSFYRHFRDIDELAIALIDLAGGTLRTIIRQARERISDRRSVIRSSVEAFMEQLEADQKLLHVLLREGAVGSDAFKRAVERELRHFEDELREDLTRLTAAAGHPLHDPALASKAITRLIFAMGGTAIDQDGRTRALIAEQMIETIRMIIAGSQQLAAPPANAKDTDLA